MISLIDHGSFRRGAHPLLNFYGVSLLPFAGTSITTVYIIVEKEAS
jgi:hypothetical protein